MTDKKIEIIISDKYTGVIFDEYMDFKECTKALSDSDIRVLSALISKFIGFRDIDFEPSKSPCGSGEVE